MNFRDKFVKYEKQIKNLSPGERGWTTPWAVSRHISGRLYLNDSYTIQPEQHGTADLLVTRTDDGIGYVIDIFRTEYKFPVHNYLPSGAWFGTRPILQVTGGELSRPNFNIPFPTFIPKGGPIVTTFIVGIVEEFKTGWNIRPYPDNHLTTFIGRDERINDVVPKIGDKAKILSNVGSTIGSQIMCIWLNGVLVVDRVPGQFLEFNRETNMTPEVPQMKRKLAIRSVDSEVGSISFQSDAVDLFKSFGTLIRAYSIQDSYILYVDRRYDFSEVLAYIKSFETPIPHPIQEDNQE